MSERKGTKGPKLAKLMMNRRVDSRVDVQLPCRLLFPNVWPGSLDGYTANLHRNGVLVSCKMNPGRQLPELGEAARVHIELPANLNFPPKFIACDTTLVRIDEVGESEFQFALKIRNVDFEDLSPEAIELMELDTESCRYVM